MPDKNLVVELTSRRRNGHVVRQIGDGRHLRKLQKREKVPRKLAVVMNQAAAAENILDFARVALKRKKFLFSKTRKIVKA